MKQHIRKTLLAFVLTAAMMLGMVDVSRAQGLVVTYWSCTYWVFNYPVWWTAGTVFRVEGTENPEYGPAGYQAGAGWVCEYIAQCDYVYVESTGEFVEHCS